jgi:hypothetical protein
MRNIKIIGGSFNSKLELEHASIAAGFPSPADDYRHETLTSTATISVILKLLSMGM